MNMVSIRRRVSPPQYDFSQGSEAEGARRLNMQRESLLYYEGPIWYERRLHLPSPRSTRASFSMWAAANYAPGFWSTGGRFASTKAASPRSIARSPRQFIPAATLWWPRWI